MKEAIIKMLGMFFKKYSFLVGLVIFAIILSNMNIGEVLNSVKNIKPAYLIFALALTIPTFINKSLCWHYIKKQQGINYKFRDSFLMYCSGLYIGLLTPGRLGEITKALYLKKDGYSMGKSLVGAVLDRITDFVFLLAFLLVGSLFLITVFQKQVLIFIIGMAITVILLIIFIKTRLIMWALKKAFDIFIPQKYKNSWKINFQEFVNDLKIYNFKNYLIIFIITAFSWLFYYLQMYILATGIGIDVPFLYLALAVTVAGFITLIPVSISGIGTRDIALIALLSPFAIATEQIVVFSLLILSMTVWGAFIGLACWLIKPIKF